MTKLIQLLNKFELLCYNFDKNESSKKIFTDQIGKIIMYTYFCSLFFISNDTKTNQFPFIEKMINCLVKEAK